MTSKILIESLKELDEYIHNEEYLDVFDLELPNNQTNKSYVKPVLTTFDEKYGSIFIMEIKIENDDKYYLQIIFGDGGVLISKSEITKNIESLKFNSSEGWSEI